MDKAQAAQFYLVSKFGADWRSKVRVVYAGDDVADEEAMKALKEDALTFRVTDNSETPTNAHHRLATPTEVLAMLQWVERFVTSRRQRTDMADLKEFGALLNRHFCDEWTELNTFRAL